MHHVGVLFACAFNDNNNNINKKYINELRIWIGPQIKNLGKLGNRKGKREILVNTK